jgi:sulfur-oxidizing protein SoxX
MNQKIVIGTIATLTASLFSAILFGCATTPSEAETASKTAEILRTSFVSKGMVKVERLDQDEVQKACTTYPNKDMPPALAQKIQQAQLAAIMMPASGNLIGDWKNGEKLAQEGRGMQISDAPDGPRGGNCYACHQITPQEISFGNIGPSLLGYGKTRGQSKEVVAYTYNKIYNSQAYSVCSNMPRFGHAKILTPEQITDIVALLLDPASPANK